MDIIDVGLILVAATIGATAALATPAVADTVLDTVDPSRADRTPPVILITLESTRADHIGPCYGYERETAPNICDLAEDGVLFEQAYGQGSWTAAAIPALITGQNPATVGLSSLDQTIPDNATTLDRILRAAGYRTSASGRNMLFYPRDDPFMQRTGRTGGPRFHWTFLDEAHGPYLPDTRFRAWDTVSDAQYTRIQNPDENYTYLWEWWKRNVYDEIGVNNTVALYDEEILQGDAQVGSLIDTLKQPGNTLTERKNAYRDALIIVTSDHGERVASPDNPSHRGWPDARTTHVPLIIKFPDNRYAGTRITRPVRHIDIVPTVLDVLGIPVPEPVDGRSLLPLIRGDETGERTVYAAGNPTSHWWIRDGNTTHRIIQPETDCPPPSALDTVTPQNETEQLHTRLCRLYWDGVRDRPAFQEGNLSDAMRTRLEQMGYLQ